jgi:dimethylamine corrinoid protein
MKPEISQIIDGLTDAVVNMDEAKAIRLSKEAISNGIDAYQAISKGLARGMEIVGENYDKGVYFVPELLVASDAMNAGMEILKPHLKTGKSLFKGKQPIIVIGVTEGDTHDIGKNLVKIMMEVSGFQIVDLGRDVPIRRFVDSAVAEKADLICLSSLMSTTMLRMGDIIKLLVSEGLRDNFKVMVGGACISPVFAQRIGADGYAPNAIAAVAKAKKLLNGKKSG